MASPRDAMYLKEMPNCGISSAPTETAHHPTHHSYGRNRDSDHGGQGVGRGRGSAIDLLPKPDRSCRARVHRLAIGLVEGPGGFTRRCNYSGQRSKLKQPPDLSYIQPGLPRATAVRCRAKTVLCSF